MKIKLWGAILFTMLLGGLLIAGCGDDDDDNPVGGNNNPENGTLTATIDGVSYTATWGASAAQLKYSDRTTITCGGFGPFNSDTCIFAITIAEPATGTFQLSRSTASTVGSVSFGNVLNEFSTYFGYGHGTVIITSYSASNIAGTFNFVGYASDGYDSTTITNGNFNMPVFTQIVQ